MEGIGKAEGEEGKEEKKKQSKLSLPFVCLLTAIQKQSLTNFITE
jgi:hypothetical protein